MIKVAKIIGTALATIGLIGAGLGFAFAEATWLFAIVMIFLLFYVFYLKEKNNLSGKFSYVEFKRSLKQRFSLRNIVILFIITFTVWYLKVKLHNSCDLDLLNLEHSGIIAAIAFTLAGLLHAIAAGLSLYDTMHMDSGIGTSLKMNAITGSAGGSGAGAGGAGAGAGGAGAGVVTNNLPTRNNLLDGSNTFDENYPNTWSIDGVYRFFRNNTDAQVNQQFTVWEQIYLQKHTRIQAGYYQDFTNHRIDHQTFLRNSRANNEIRVSQLSQIRDLKTDILALRASGYNPNNQTVAR